MPGKHVHFAPTNQFYSPVPPTPSPSFSVSSLPESNGPMTPPPFGKTSPYSTTPLPPVDNYYPPGSVHIDPSLGLGTSIKYDLTLDPTSSFTKALSSKALSQPATYPPLPSIKLICKPLPWSIRITASSSNPDAFVTISDVLHGIYRHLRLNATPDEFNALPSRDAKERVTASYQLRYRSIMDRKAYELEKSKGLKRVDFLMGHTKFLGLSSTKRGPDVWELNVS